MLGLGLGLNKGGRPKLRDLITNLDLTQPATDFFNSYNVEGGAITFSSNATIASESGWLKGVFPNSAQNAPSGISHINISPEADATAGRLFKVKFELYLETAANWTEGGASQATITVSFGNTTTNVDVTPDSKVTIDTGVKSIDFTGLNDLIIYFNEENELPEANAAFYIKNFEFRMGNDNTAVTG